jgi:uncharacterized protein (TIGR02588 family)
MPDARAAERVEWVAGGLSALVVLAIVGFLLREAVFGADSPPELVATVEAPGAGRHLRYVVVNRGGQAAAGVTLALTVSEGGRLVEERLVIVDDVPPHSRVTGGVYLPEGAEGLTVDLAVEGYVDP